MTDKSQDYTSPEERCRLFSIGCITHPERKDVEIVLEALNSQKEKIKTLEMDKKLWAESTLNKDLTHMEQRHLDNIENWRKFSQSKQDEIDQMKIDRDVSNQAFLKTNKKQLEETEHLKKELDDKQQELLDYIDSSSQAYNELVDEIKSLKEEKKKLQDCVDYTAKSRDDLWEERKQLKEKIYELNQEKKPTSEVSEWIPKAVFEQEQARCNLLVKRNEELEEENKILSEPMRVPRPVFEQVKIRCEELEKRNKKLENSELEISLKLIKAEEKLKIVEPKEFHLAIQDKNNYFNLAQMPHNPMMQGACTYEKAKEYCEQLAKEKHKECRVLGVLSRCIPQKPITNVVWKEIAK